MDDPAAVGGHRGHRDAVEFADGAVILACSHPAGGYRQDERPDFGLYLDPQWRPPWPHGHVDWPDFGLPVDDGELHTALDDLLRRARGGASVEIGCLGGHGRTGTALACLAVLSRLDVDPVEWVRARYCDRAIETAEQVDYVHRFALRYPT